MDNYVQHNCSVTISYDDSEVPDIIEWFMKNWDSYVGVSFLYRNDPSKTAQDLGYPYLPQEVVDEEIFKNYTSTLLDFDLDDKEKYNTFEINTNTSLCVNGICPDK
jgi:ribonucleoside-triphosphate reductase